jgi:hypothetical protein
VIPEQPAAFPKIRRALGKDRDSKKQKKGCKQQDFSHGVINSTTKILPMLE